MSFLILTFWIRVANTIVFQGQCERFSMKYFPSGRHPFYFVTHSLAQSLGVYPFMQLFSKWTVLVGNVFLPALNAFYSLSALSFLSLAILAILACYAYFLSYILLASSSFSFYFLLASSSFCFYFLMAAYA